MHAQLLLGRPHGAQPDDMSVALAQLTTCASESGALAEPLLEFASSLDPEGRAVQHARVVAALDAATLRGDLSTGIDGLCVSVLTPQPALC